MAQPIPRPAHLDPRDNYFNSTVDLRRGIVMCELSLGHLPNEEVHELLRLRQVWRAGA